MTDLLEIADELYGLPLDKFTAARNAHKDPAVKKLPKPSAAAWAINQFARSSPDKLAQVIDLGEQLREAQEDLDAATLRQLGTQRRALISAVAKEIGGAPSIRTDVEQTLQAAMADRWAAVAVSSGRLLRSLTADGLDPADLEGAVAAPSGMSAPQTPAKKPSASARKKAQDALDAATAAREAAEQAVADAEQRIDAADGEEQTLTQAVDELSAQLETARAQLDAAAAASGRLARERTALLRKVEQAELAEEKARARVDKL